MDKLVGFARKKRLGDLLVDAGVISQDQLVKALQIQKTEKKGKLTWRHLAGPARPPLQRAAWLAKQAAKVLGGGTAARHAAARRPASPSRRPDGLDELHVAPRPSWTPPFAPSSSPSRSHAMADATVAAPPP